MEAVLHGPPVIGLGLISGGDDPTPGSTHMELQTRLHGDHQKRDEDEEG